METTEVEEEVLRTLLIVEDDASFAKALRRSFERRGYEVHACAGLEEMRELLQTVDPDYAVIDLKLATGLFVLAMLALPSLRRGRGPLPARETIRE